MVPRLLVAAGCVLSSPALAQEPDPDSGGSGGGVGGVEGRWVGSVVLPTGGLPFSVTFERAEDVLVATMDIQGAVDLPLTAVSHENDRVHFELETPIGLAAWDGALTGDTIEGEFTQGVVTATFSVSRADPAEAEAEEPPPYREEEVSFENGDVHLEGTLTLPEGPGPFPGVVLITGSGPQDRDEVVAGFAVFRHLSDHLTRQGIAVLRYDDRGVGGSTGSVSSSTSSDFAGDALAGLARLSEHPDVDPARVGLLGHSEGAIVAPIAASRSEAVRFAVLLAGSTVPGTEILYEQSAAIQRASGVPEDRIEWNTDFQRRLFAALDAGEDLEAYREELGAAIREGIETLPGAQRAAISDVDAYVQGQIDAQIDRVETPWFRYFLTYDPTEGLRGTRVPVLALFGGLDLQVLPDQNRPPLEEALAGNPDVTVDVLPRANHLFQAATSGSPAEYALLEKRFVDGFLETISDWILARFGN
ncbi:MAG: alpha/beta fold hydrolase [Gemmatimonadota bacterium]|uniref:alpha/beta hydrolase n=1 Tax=Candidatus Palauibacter scopulicola TaxID=3056741 RepID=UPI002390341C|nr:alpha/beta fold hydrolase [Candidatus Palauibacter scopulicola]MDE2662672.1 alpha/beta fold hydrolase [Candidatus Palauibacter scopulicola]